MTEVFRFSKYDRWDLTRSLRANGCRPVTREILDAFEVHVARYHRKVVAKGQVPALFSLVQAFEIREATLDTWAKLDELTPANKRRMIRKLPRKDDAPLAEYKAGVDQIRSGSGYAFKKSCKEMAAENDPELKRLCRKIAREWKKATGRSFPSLPDDDGSEFRLWRWQEIRQLQRHPLWIAMHSLGISMPVGVTSTLEECAFID